MREIIRGSVQLLIFALGFSLLSGRAQGPAQADRPNVSAGISAEKPVFAGACKACPWGFLAKVTADALNYYGYQTTVVRLPLPHCPSRRQRCAPDR